MKPSRLIEVLSGLLDTDWAVFIWGPPGVGKSAIVREAARIKRMHLIDIRASLLDPTDIRGIPIVRDGEAVWCPPSFLPSKETSHGVLFFDELNSAPTLVQASLYQLTLDRRVGEYRLPSGWRIVAAGNRAEDHAITYRVPSALNNRFIHLDYEVDYNDWREWAIRKGIHPLVIAFLNLRRNLLFDMRSSDRAFPTPRTWEAVSDILHRFENPERIGDLIPGIIGEAAAVEFVTFCREQYQEKRLQAIIENPDTAPLPEKLGEAYLLVSYLIARAKEEVVQRAAGVLLARLNVELGILLLNDMLKVAPRFALNPGACAFIASHAEMVAA